MDESPNFRHTTRLVESRLRGGNERLRKESSREERRENQTHNHLSEIIPYLNTSILLRSQIIANSVMLEA